MINRFDALRECRNVEITVNAVIGCGRDGSLPTEAEALTEEALIRGAWSS